MSASQNWALSFISDIRKIWSFINHTWKQDTPKLWYFLQNKFPPFQREITLIFAEYKYVKSFFSIKILFYITLKTIYLELFKSKGDQVLDSMTFINFIFILPHIPICFSVKNWRCKYCWMLGIELKIGIIIFNFWCIQWTCENVESLLQYSFISNVESAQHLLIRIIDENF